MALPAPINLEKIIGYSELLNVILVDNNVRPAMLIQPVDYGEEKGTDPKTSAKLTAIKKAFPHLIQSEKYSGIYQGVLIAKKSFDSETIDLNRMGRVLGYPCYKNFEKMNRDKINYIKEIIVYFTPESGILPKQLLANVCIDNTHKKEFEDIRARAEKVLKSNKMIGTLVTRVSLKESSKIPMIAIINKLVKKEPFSKDEKDEILNIIYNCSFMGKNQSIFNKTFQYFNTTHLSMLLCLLLHEQNNPMEPFWPLQNNGLKKMKEVDDISIKFAESFNDVLQRTSIRRNVRGKSKKNKLK